MKVLHIIPNAFDYFEEINTEAFKILEAESDLGVEADAITLNYGSVTRKDTFEVKKSAPSRKFVGQEPVEKNIEAWEYYDIINLHCPFFGAAEKILQWVTDHPEKSLIITYHHDFKTPDFFGYLIKFYNYYYLPKLFKVARHVTFFADRRNLSQVGLKMLKDEEKIVVLGLPLEEADTHNPSIAEDLVMVYNILASK